MKDLVSYSLDVNIPMQNNIPENRLFNLVVLATDYYRPIRPLILIKSIFFWLNRLNPLVNPPTNPHYTKRENHSDNCNIGNESNEVFWTEEIPLTNLDCIKSEIHNNNCSKNYYNINNGVGI